MPAEISQAAAQEAIVRILMMAKICDGSSTRQDEVFLSSLKRAHSLAGMTEAELIALEARVASSLTDIALPDAAAIVPEHLRVALFAQALDIILADGELSEKEADFVNGLILNLDLDRADVEPVVDVIAMKNRL